MCHGRNQRGLSVKTRLNTWLKYSINASSALCFLLSSIGAAQAEAALDLISGVSFPGGNARGQSVFLSTDPGYGAYSGKKYPTYLLQAGKKPNFPVVGINFPAKNNGVLSAPIGNFVYLAFSYDVPNNGPSAGDSLIARIQTADGLYHEGTLTSYLFASYNGYNQYNCYVRPDQFTPAFDVGSTTLLTASLRFSGTPSVKKIYVWNPIVAGQNYYNTTFAFKTLPDSSFNN